VTIVRYSLVVNYQMTYCAAWTGHTKRRAFAGWGAGMPLDTLSIASEPSDIITPSLHKLLDTNGCQIASETGGY
jgi:hypothetical protein